MGSTAKLFLARFEGLVDSHRNLFFSIRQGNQINSLMEHGFYADSMVPEAVIRFIIDNRDSCYHV
jgi:hypothetical protein